MCSSTPLVVSEHMPIETILVVFKFESIVNIYTYIHIIYILLYIYIVYKDVFVAQLMKSKVLKYSPFKNAEVKVVSSFSGSPNN